mgnify:CR=1 FL=1
MTLTNLIKKLQKIKKENPNRRFKVFVDCKEAKEKLNDVFEIVEIDDAVVKSIEIGDGDGFGTERYSTSVILS